MAASSFAGAMIPGSVPLADWLVVAPVAIAIVTGAALAMGRRLLPRPDRLALLALGLMALADAALLARVLSDGPLVMAMGAWLPPFGIVFAAEPLGAAMALTGTVVALLATVNLVPEINAGERYYGAYAFLLLMMAGVNGAFLTGDLFNLYVWFEVLLISSIGLMVIGSRKRQIDGALKYGVLNLVATTLFLIATGYLYAVLGSLNMADIAVRVRAATPDLPLASIAVLFLVAFGMKAAAFPLNFWLPASYHTPDAAVSAIVAALLTKVGVYALLKTEILLFGLILAEFRPMIAFIAGAGMLTGAFGALAQSDIRRLIGYTVIAGIGMAMAGLSLPGSEGPTASVFYALQSMPVLAALYLVAGHIEARCGSGDLRKVGGLASEAPLLSAAGLVLIFAAAGLPPFSAFWPKAMLVEAAVAAGAPGLVVTLLLSSLILLIALVRVALFAFWRPAPASMPVAPAATPPLAPVLILTTVVVIIGLVPSPLHALAARAIDGLLDPAAYIAAVLGGTP